MMSTSKYKYSKQAGALQEAALPAPTAARQTAQAPPADEESYVAAHDSGLFSLSELTRLAANQPVTAQSTNQRPNERTRRAPAPLANSREAAPYRGRYSMFFYTVEEGQRVMAIRKDGSMQVIQGPQRVFHWGKSFRPMEHHVAHPGEFLIVRYRDGRQEHVRGPAHVWRDPRDHLGIGKEEIFQIADREAIVVYSKDASTGRVTRRIVHGPEDFMPEPGEWLHTFSWHGSRHEADGSYRKVPNGLVFQKLWLLPDQMYHDVPEVRTADGAVLTIRLMIFFELVDIEKMLATTHDPIGDFVNAATSDVVEFLSKHDFEAFKESIEKLNDLSTYKQLTARADQCGYRISKVVYRGYGAPAALQQMHEQALESRTRLQLEKDTERQAQELEDLKLERRLSRSAKEREERGASHAQELQLETQRQKAEIEHVRSQRERARALERADVEQAIAQERARKEAQGAWLQRLNELGVDLTAYLTQGRPDQVIELRGEGRSPAHVHLGVPAQDSASTKNSPPRT